MNGFEGLLIAAIVGVVFKKILEPRLKNKIKVMEDEIKRRKESGKLQ